MCEFSIQFKKNSEEVVEKFKIAIESNGGTFQGNTNAGKFAVSKAGSAITGSYTITQQTLNVVIDKLPILISCDTVKRKIEEFINNTFAPSTLDFFIP